MTSPTTEGLVEQPVAWALFNPATGKIDHRCYQREEAARAGAANQSNPWRTFVVVPLFLHPEAAQRLSALERENERLRAAMRSDAQIKHMVDRFLSWRLPENFNPDAGISFKREFNEHTAHPMKHEPIGTNLLDATQAEAMVRHILEGLPQEDDNG